MVSPSALDLDPLYCAEQVRKRGLPGWLRPLRLPMVETGPGTKRGSRRSPRGTAALSGVGPRLTSRPRLPRPRHRRRCRPAPSPGQIVIPKDLADILKAFTKEVIRAQVPTVH